jgi:hypothetical protein
LPSIETIADQLSHSSVVRTAAARLVLKAGKSPPHAVLAETSTMQLTLRAGIHEVPRRVGRFVVC